MPAPVAPIKKHTPLPTVLRWIGVGLASLAALILLAADGSGALRIGGVLTILAVVLIGLSIALPANSGDGAAGGDAEQFRHEVRGEIERLRHELRGEIVAAAQRGNQALDQAQRTQETVTALRRRLDAAAAGMAAIAGGTAPAAEEPAAARARVPSAETYDEGRPDHRRAAPEAAPTGEGQPFGREGDESPRRPQPDTRYGADLPQPGVYGTPRTAQADVRPEPRPAGVVHHTETVHVTRHTIMDGSADPVAGTGHGGYAGRWSRAPEERPGSGVDADGHPRSGHREAADDRSRSGGEYARPAPGGQWAGGSWSGPDGESAPPGPRPPRLERASRDERAPRDELFRPGEHAATGTVRDGDGGSSGDDRRWTPGRAENSSWSTGPADPRSWPATSEGSADERGQTASRDDRAWSADPDGSRDEGSRAGRAAWHHGRNQAGEG
ncbi:hypothetical protein ACNAW0_29200, partial [Micromonospora sp. SL1-18]